MTAVELDRPLPTAPPPAQAMLRFRYLPNLNLWQRRSIREVFADRRQLYLQRLQSALSCEPTQVDWQVAPLSVNPLRCARRAYPIPAPRIRLGMSSRLKLSRC